MERLKLKDLIDTAINKLQDEKYSKDTVDDYKFVWNKFYNMCELFKVEYFDYNIAIKFLEKYYHVDIKTRKGRNYCRRMRCMNVLNSIDNNEKIGIYRPQLIDNILSNYNDILKEYEEYLVDNNYTNSAVYASRDALTKLFTYLENNKVLSIDKIKINDIYSFVNSLNTSNYSQATIYNIKYKLKFFFQYLYENNKFKFSGYDIFPKIAKYDRAKLPSYYTIEEINKMIKQIDTSTKCGKRDLAIFLLASVYGLRNSDIVHLKKKNIIWSENKIELIQYKTKKLLELPLTDNVKLALLDYLKNVRPDIDSEYVFLPTKPPYKYVNGEKYSSLYKSMSIYAKKAGVYCKNKKLGLHTLRHSVANNMLKNNIDIKIISNILGHSSVDVTNIYLGIDVPQLRKLTLEVPSYE